MLPTWVVVWIQVSILIVLWDASFVLLRPLSMEGGPYEAIYAPYKKYITVDKMYGHMEEDGTKFFIVAQSIVNLVEVTFLQISIFLHLQKDPRCELVAFSASLCVAAKTVLYATVEVVSGSRHTSQNNWADFIFLYVIPNGLWIVFPMLIVVTLGSRIATRLYALPNPDPKKKHK
eukprot:m.22040 g.22040  ORF g.22040 m.22040 type:complete len:175 (-) comp8217_c0_seq1:49-573(-)